MIDQTALDELHTKLSLYTRQLWDIQKTRVAVGNRVAAMEEDRLPEPLIYGLRVQHADLKRMEKGLDRTVGKMAREHFMADWINAQPGIGLAGFARVVAITGDFARFRSVYKLWKYLGLHVTPDGTAPRRKKGDHWTHTDCQFNHTRKCKKGCPTDHHPHCVPDSIGTAYVPQGRVLASQLAESIIKLNKGPYRALYDSQKLYYETERPEWSQGRCHNAAKRYAIKCLLRDMWVEWRRRARVSLKPDGTLPA